MSLRLEKIFKIVRKLRMTIVRRTKRRIIMKRISLSPLCNALGYIQQATEISQSQCRKLLDEAAGLSITASRRIFLARNCV